MHFSETLSKSLPKKARCLESQQGLVSSWPKGKEIGVARIVWNMNGQLRVKSDKGQGSLLLSSCHSLFQKKIRK